MTSISGRVESQVPCRAQCGRRSSAVRDSSTSSWPIHSIHLRAHVERKVLVSSAPSATRFEPAVQRERLLHAEGISADLQREERGRRSKAVPPKGARWDFKANL